MLLFKDMIQFTYYNNMLVKQVCNFAQRAKPIYTCFLYLFRDSLLWIFNSCKYSKKKRKLLSDIEIRDKAL